MKPGVRQIVGKRIVGVVTAENPGGVPRTQAFLLFSDGSRFEFYGEHFSCCDGLDKGEGVLRYIASAGAKVTRAYGRVEAVPAAVGPERKADEDVEALLKRDLDAWEMAKAAVARARRRRGDTP